MPFIPHTPNDLTAMLKTIGISDIDQLFDEIPNSLRTASFKTLPEGLSEMALSRLVETRAASDEHRLCFIGAGAYEHHIPAVCFDLSQRGELMTAYTPYQAEASQGILQIIYEFQTMMANLLAMEVSNASLYDGATALAEAVLMAIRSQNKSSARHILMPKTVHPFYRQTVKSIVTQQGTKLIDVPYLKETGQIDQTALNQLMSGEIAALVIPQPNFFGVLEEVDQLTDWAKTQSILSIGVVNPLSMALLKPPGEWGQEGVDIACGEGQSLGVPLAGGGPYYGLLCAKKKYIRQMPGRIVGRTKDLDGNTGYVLTLQAREQHIRRGKATSNICTNQGLLVTLSTIYMGLMGPEGLRRVALASHQRMQALQKALAEGPKVFPYFKSSYFHEMVFQFQRPCDALLSTLAKSGIEAGFDVSRAYPELKNCLLICATETKTQDDINFFVTELCSLLQGGKLACLA